MKALTDPANAENWEMQPRTPRVEPVQRATFPAKRSPQENQPLMEARRIAKSFNGVPALVDGRILLRAGSIHALCGGNGAGKSTFLNILTGILKRDSGDLYFKGRLVDFASPKESLAAGISIITQELSPVLDLSVAENLFLRSLPKKAGFVQWKALYRQATELLDRLSFNINPRSLVRDLPLAQIQLVEIAKAMNRPEGVDLLIMDEPTSALGETDVAALFQSIRRLTELGTGIIYVSHRMGEVEEICDEYTVFRDGRFIQSGQIEETSKRELISLIIGREYEEKARPNKTEIAAPILSLDKVSLDNRLREVSLTLNEGEILGIYGLSGAGRTELLNVIYGLEQASEGKISFDGKAVPPSTPSKSIARGIALVPEDRKAEGLVLNASVRDNLSLSSLASISRFGLLKKRDEVRRTHHWIEELRIKAATIHLPVQSMSGGNQQKVVLARALETQPKLLLLDEPTRGVDAGAKQEIYEIIEAFVNNRRSVIVVSSEVEEILGLCHRIVVLKRGRVVSTLKNDGTVTASDLLQAAS